MNKTVFKIYLFHPSASERFRPSLIVHSFLLISHSVIPHPSRFSFFRILHLDMVPDRLLVFFRIARTSRLLYFAPQILSLNKP